MFLVRVLFTDTTQVTTDIAQFEGITEQYPEILNGLIVFPEKIPENVEETDYYFSCTESLDYIYEIYLKCQYTQDDYEKELERLENTKKQYGSKVNKLLKDSGEKFNFPAYIAQENDYMAYEYALLSGEREITYIYSSHFDYASTSFEEQYLPIYTKGISDKLTASPGYSIYDFEVDDYVETDYSRDALAQIEIRHWKSIGYNTFCVSVVLDENDNEIIADCSYSYYENKINSIYGLPEEKIYTDLNGYEFVRLELNEEKTKAYVTYLDEGEEKVWEYEIKE